MEPTSGDITGPAQTASGPIIIVSLATTIPTLVESQVGLETPIVTIATGLGVMGLGVTGPGTTADTAPYSEDDSEYEALR